MNREDGSTNNDIELEESRVNAIRRAAATETQLWQHAPFGKRPVRVVYVRFVRRGAPVQYLLSASSVYLLLTSPLLSSA